MRVLLWLLISTLPAAALGGSAARFADAAFSGSTVMVLGTRGSACSGTVVGLKLVLTAAHCVEGSKQIAIAWLEAGQPKLMAVTASARHPQAHTGSAVSVDLALLALGEALPPRFSPAPIDAGEAPHELGAPRVLAGYGLAEDGVDASAGQLRTASTVVLPKLLPRFLRLGTVEGGMNAFRICTGDSGGGVFTPDGMLVAVIAQRERLNGGKTCGPVAQAVRTAPQIGWIKATMAKLGK